MRFPRIQSALGVDGSRDDRLARRIVFILCALYAVSFLAFYPRAITNDDESIYVRQTLVVLERIHGNVVTKVDPVTGARDVYTGIHDSGRPGTRSTYPYGTVLTMAPFVALAGWRGGYVVPAFALVFAVLLLARWLAEEGRSPLFALLLLGYPPALVMGRVAMSDVPSTAIVTLGLLLFWRGIDRGWGWWLASGFVAGGSMIFRESNPIPFAPFFAGTVLRRDRRAWALVVGGLAGLSLRLLANITFSGDPLYYRSPYILALDTIQERLPMYTLATMIFIPGGLLFALLYRGRRWPELRIAVAFFVISYLIQSYYTFATSTLKNAIITPRYVIPIIPVMAFAMAESVPRLWRALLDRLNDAWRHRAAVAAPPLVALWIIGVGLAAVAVHPIFFAWSATQANIRDAIEEHVGHDAVIVTNYMATRKFLNEFERSYLPVHYQDVGVEGTDALVERYGDVYIVFLERTDSEYWRNEGGTYPKFLADLAYEPELTYEFDATSTDHLRIWRVRAANRRGG